MIKQRFWKQLKSQLCPRENWVSNNDQPKCQCCSKQFIFIFKRRHHCRFCGKIFCSDCSNHFINGTYIGLDSQKFVRCCQFCFEEIQKYIRQCSKVSDINHEKSQEQQSDEEYEQFNTYNLNNFFEEEKEKNSEAEISLKLDDDIKNILKSASQYFCSKFEVDGKLWSPKLADIALKAASETKIDAIVEANNQSPMDITKKVRVKTIISPINQITCVIIKGIVLEKNLPTKNMLTHLNHPRILVVQKSIDMDSLSSLMKFEDLVKNQKQIMKKILEKLVKFNPDIIFVENSVSMFALEYLQQRKIVVVNKIKGKDLQMIKYVGKVKKTIKKLWMIDKYKSQSVLGGCDKIYFKNIKEGQSLMFMEGEVGIRSIILGENTEDIVSMLKKFLQILMRFARQKLLEKQLAMVDIQMMAKLVKKIKFPFINGILFNEDKNQNRLVKQQIAFTRAYFSKINLVIDGKKNQSEYMSRIGKNTTKQICSNIEYQRKKIYSADDMTLGSFILLISANYDHTCAECRHTHCQNIYIGNISIKIDVNNSQQSEKSKSFVSDINENQGLTLQNLKFFIKKQKQLLVIQTYIQCQNCETKFCQPIKVGRNYLENSFLNFVSNIAQFSNLDQDKSYVKVPGDRKISFRKSSFDKCWHDEICRVFKYSGIMIKFQVEKSIVLDVDYINIQSQQSKALYATYDQSFIRNTYSWEIQEKKDILQKIINSMPNINQANINDNQIPSKLIPYFSQVNKIKQLLQKTKEEVNSIELKVIKNEDLGHDWTLFMRQIYKIQAILIPAIEILTFLDGQIRKEGIQETFNKQDIHQPSEQINKTSEDHLSFTLDIQSRESTMAPLSPVRKDTDQSSQLQKFAKKKGKIRFPRSEGNFLYFNPIFVNDPVSVIANGLNSQEFKKCLEEGNIPNQLKLKIAYNYRLKTKWDVKSQIDMIYNQFFGEKEGDKDKYDTAELTIHYHKQFEDLRKRQGISLDLFVRSMCGCRSWSSSGGKSNSKFAKSHNELLVVKVINDKQFVQFQRFCPSYLEYIKQSKINKHQSLLARIYGIYEVSMRGKHQKCIVMQNIFFGMNGNLKVYDLKGSQLNRLNMPPVSEQKSFTGQDTNFKLDRDGEPLIISPTDYDRVIKTLEHDGNFLKQQAVIDYSLLVILNGNKQVRMGIIDFMRPYQFLEKLQTVYKQLKSGEQPTVIPPEKYAERFIKAIKKYLIKVQS